MTASSKISICIPSYNRKKLSECLSSLIPLVRNREIPVYVQDNFEGPPLDYSGYSYPHLHYEQNPRNIGADLNMFRCLRKAQTSHALWLGDDDHITEAFLQYIYIYIYMQNDLPDLLLLNEDGTSKQYDSLKSFYLNQEPNPIYFGNCVVRTDFLHDFDEQLYLRRAPLHVYNTYINYYLSKIENQHGKCRITVNGDSLIIRGSTDKTWSRHYLRVMLIDVFRFYFSQCSPLRRYAIYMCFKRVFYYISQILAGKCSK